MQQHANEKGAYHQDGDAAHDAWNEPTKDRPEMVDRCCCGGSPEVLSARARGTSTLGPPRVGRSGANADFAIVFGALPRVA